MHPGDRTTVLRLLAVCAGVELLLFLILVAFGREGFFAFISTPDTGGYLRLAEHVADNFTLTASERTLGYPLFIALANLAVGRLDAPYVVIGVQLLINLGFTWGCWRLLQKLQPAAPVRLRVCATVLFFWAGLGMALYLMTDFLAAACFGVFIYGLFFWRSRQSLLLSGVCLGLATIIRPAFTLIPVLLPALAYLTGRITSHVPRFHVLAFAACSLIATSVSVAYQYAFNGYFGPSPVLILPIQEMIYDRIVQPAAPGLEYSVFRKQFHDQIGIRAGRPFNAMLPGEQEKYAKEIFREQAIEHPTAIFVSLSVNFLKYLFTPVESIMMRFARLRLDEQEYASYVRPFIIALCMPIWFLAFLPPFGSSRDHKIYYLFFAGVLLCTVGLAAITRGSGERIRFPVLPLMLPLMVWNVQRAHSYVTARIDEWRGKPEPFAA